MGLDFDLRSSVAKVAQASVHYKTFEREFHRLVEYCNPHTIDIGKVNPDGWAPVFSITIPSEENLLGLIAGDVIHNLRCALDYIVSELAVASKVEVTNRHQFPIFKSEAKYCRQIGTDKSALPSGSLGGITCGLSDIWDVQPFHREPDPEADPLFAIYRFSNADKHRIISENFYPLANINGRIWCTNNGRIIDSVGYTEAKLLPDGNYEIGRVRFAFPLPSNTGFEGEFTVKPFLRTPAFLDDLEYTMYGDTLETLCKHVAIILKRFANL